MLKKFIVELIRFSRQKAILSVLLFILTGLTQGVGLVLIIPLLQTIGLTGESGAAGGITKIIANCFGFVGLPLNLFTILAVYIVLVSSFAALKRYQAVLNVEIQQGFVRFLKNRLYESLAYAEDFARGSVCVSSRSGS